MIWLPSSKPCSNELCSVRVRTLNGVLDHFKNYVSCQTSFTAKTPRYARPVAASSAALAYS